MNPVLQHFLMKSLLGILLGLALMAEAGLPSAWAQDIGIHGGRSTPHSPSRIPLSSGMDATSSFGEIIAKPLNLETCVRIALDKNPLIRAVQEGVAAAKEGIGEARASYYPDLALNAGYSHWQKYAFLPSGIARPGISPSSGLLMIGLQACGPAIRSSTAGSVKPNYMQPMPAKVSLRRSPPESV